MTCRFFPDSHRGCVGEPCATRAACSWVRYDARQATAARRKAIRTFPMPKFPNSGRFVWCGWCGGEIVHGRVKQRFWHDGREDEPDCKFEWQLSTDPRVQRPFLIERDGEKCAGCGSTPGRWSHDGWPTIPYTHGGRRAFHPEDARIEHVGEFWGIEWVSALEIEHTVPLWSVAHLPDEERRKFFGPDYLKLLGPCCHKPKTAAEAKVRAKGNRQAKMRLDVPREPPAKGHRRLQGGGKLPGLGKGRKLGSRPLRSRNSFQR